MTKDNMITVRVRFPTGPATYDYAAPSDWGICVGDLIVIPGDSRRTATVVEVLKTLSAKTTRGIAGHYRSCPAVDKWFQDCATINAEVDKQLEAMRQQHRYALAASMNSNLKQKLEELGLL